MNTKNDCWLCGRGSGIDNGDLVPGELRPNFFGDLECLDCTKLLDFTGQLLLHPETIPVVKDIKQAARKLSEMMPSAFVGIKIEQDEEA